MRHTLEMLATVKFDHQSRTEGNEINDPWADRHLPSELEAGEATVAEVEPQSPLGIGGLPAEVPGEHRAHGLTPRNLRA